MGLKKRTKVSAEFSMSSLTDIIFLLLIFFMLTSSLVSPTAINLKLPSSSSKPTNKSTTKPIKLDINKRGEYTINGKRLAESAVRGKILSLINKDGRNPDDITVILSINEAVDAQTLVTNVDLLNDYGVKMILATKLSD
jgi:biopolymer transport protein ExbD